MPQRNCKIQPNGDTPNRAGHKSYLDKWGTNPMKMSMDNCFIKTRLGTDPVTGKPITVFDEQRDRERQILESLGELVRIWRHPIIPDIGLNGGKRCICWDDVRKTGRSSCPLCNGFGIITTSPSNDQSNPLAIHGYQLLRNPDRPDGLFFISESYTDSVMKTRDVGLFVEHEFRAWTVFTKNCEGKIVNVLGERDVFIRYIFNQETGTPIQELARYEITATAYSLVQENMPMHQDFSAKRLQPGVDSKAFSLPNGL
jgi:hypothetical protein